MYTLSTYAVLDHKTWVEAPLDRPSTTTEIPRMTSVKSEAEFHKAQGHEPGMQGQAVTHLTWSHPTTEMVGRPSVFTGQTLFVGQIGRRTGTLTLSCTGTYTPKTGNLKADLEVLWGTGDLEGAKGDGGWERLAGPPDAGTSWLDLASHAKLITGAEVVLDLEFLN
ncbi:SO1590-like domain [Phaffia rhodozyma]|uniref:SO1590-like domain n=1 Tax=Phaffia rhodozyma TaxID=264483 RepID=A0A0F7STN3_PHARH|nr:SO1590-like domain [Phaffia rhodozyma]